MKFNGLVIEISIRTFWFRLRLTLFCYLFRLLARLMPYKLPMKISKGKWTTVKVPWAIRLVYYDPDEPKEVYEERVRRAEEALRK